MLKRFVVEILIGLAWGLALLWCLERHSVKEDKQITSLSLPADTQEKLIVDPRRHIITIVTRNGTTTQYFPPNVSSAIDVTPHGTVTLHTRSYGTELGCAIGASYSDKLRVGLAVPLLYYKRFEIGPVIAMGISPKIDGRISLNLFYNVWDNTSLTIGIQTNKSPTGGFSIRF